MSFLKLSWCQLIKIILSQIGGNPLQQIYSQLNQGKPTMAPGGIIPAGLADVKNFIETIVSTVNAAQQAAGDFSDTLDKLSNEFYQNPLGTIIGTTQTSIDERVADIDEQLAEETANPGTLTVEEKASLESEKIFLVGADGISGLQGDLNTYLDNTDRLIGLRPQSSSGQAGCSLQDLLGSGCTPNEDVPDVDIKALIEGLKKEDLIAAVNEKIKNATGISDLEDAIADFKSEIQGFNTEFLGRINRAAVRNAVTGQITQLVFNLLTGCGNTIFDLTLKSNVKTAVAPYVAALEQQRDGDAYYDGNGELVTPEDTEVSFPEPEVDVNSVNLDVATPATAPSKYYINGQEVSKEVYDAEKQAMIDFRSRSESEFNATLEKFREEPGF